MSTKLEQAFELRKQGLTFKEIAQEVGCSEGYIKTQLSGVAKGEASLNFEALMALRKISEDLAEVVRKLK